MTDYAIPVLGWVCARCGSVWLNGVYECPRCKDEGQEDLTSEADSEEGEG